MPSQQDRNQLATEELREASMQGPFGGVQSELPLTLIEEYGFADLQNILFRKGAAYSRPTYSILNAQGNTPLNFASYWDSLSFRRQILFTFSGLGTNVLRYNGPGWTALAGPVLSATGLPFATTVLNNKLCFTRALAAEQLYLQDEQTGPGTYVLASAQAPAARNLIELGLHLMTSYTVEGGAIRPMRYRWSGAGDPTDWVSFSAGVNDILLDLGPANGLLKLGQYGFGWHAKGIIQVIPTGLGFAPFAFPPLASTNVGLSCIYSLQKVTLAGVESGVYVGPDNVYLFNQTASVPIGDAPIGNRRRLGARSRIMADIQAASFGTNVRGFISQSLLGVPFNAYWLICTSSLSNAAVDPVWVYNFDEDNWTRLIFNRVPLTIGNFAAQPNVFTQTDATDELGIGFNDTTIGILDFGQAGSETSYIVKSGKYIFGDRRHKHTIKKFRLAWTDLGSVSWTLTIINESGVSAQQTATLGTGSNDDLTYIFSVPINGLRLQWTLTAPVGAQFAIVEFCPMFDTGGEQRGGTVDAN